MQMAFLCKGKPLQFTQTWRIMRLVTVSMIAFCLHVSARSVSQTITLSGTAMPLQKVFAEIKNQTGSLFFYRNEDLAGTTPVSVNLKATPLDKALNIILAGEPLSFTIQGNTIFLTRKSPPPALTNSIVNQADTATQTVSVQGVVFNEEKTVMEGATVAVLSDRRLYTTNAAGLFNIPDVPLGSVILITNVGCSPYRIIVDRHKTSFSVQMNRLTNKLDDVQVIAYGTTTKGAVTSPISSVKAKDIRDFPLGSFDQMLEGMAPGVFVQSASGAPGKTSYINIRGQNSFIGSAPLVVVDGLPVLSDPLDDNTLGATHLDPLASINPGDIESIDILKDAGSTAIYGSRAAGGVILVTTKRGKQGKTVITVNGTQGAGIPAGRLHLLGTKDYIALRREGFRNDNPGQPLPSDLASLDSTTSTNWQNLLYKPTTISEYKIGLSGGNSLTQLYMSGGYRRETNPLSGKKGLERETFRLNLDHKEGKRLKISASIGAGRTSDQNAGDQAGGTFSAASSGTAAPPDTKPYDSAGNFTFIPLASGAVGNPLAIYSVKLNDVTTQLKTSVSVNYEIFDGFAFHTDMGYDYNTLAEKLYIPKKVNATLQNVLYDAEIQNNASNTYSLEPQFRLNRGWNNRADILETVIGTTFQKTESSSNTLYGLGFPSDDIQEMSAASTTFGSSSSVTYAFNSLFGRVNYNHKGKYIVNTSFRRDGSSHFGPANRFGNFGAVSGAWVFSREKFASGWNFLSNGKLRGSYGIVGNDAIGDFTYLDLWKPDPYNNQPGSIPISASNPNVKWERTTKFDVGVDLGFFHDRIGLALNYFDNLTGNLLVTQPTPTQTGFISVPQNLPGQVRNSGIEIELNTVNIHSRDFQWSTKFNFTRQHNILKKFPGLDINPTYNTHYVIGKSLNLLWGYKFNGVDSKTGNPIYDGFNLDGTPTNPTALNPGLQVIGSSVAKYFGGMINNFAWKRFTLDVFLQFVQGYDEGSQLGYLNNSSAFTNNQLVDVLHRWQGQGDITNTPRSATANTAWWVNSGIDGASSRFVSDASYVRVKNISLGYSLPAKTLAGMKMSEVRIYASAENLAVFTHFKGIDPETGAGVAPIRMIVGGINLAF
jgi:TonB-dependent starch-binding outer membrane protein SusC